MSYSVARLADMLDMSIQGIRTAIRRGLITVLPEEGSSVRVSPEAVERYRRRKTAFRVSWALEELPSAAADEPARLLFQRGVEVGSGIERRSVLVRAYRPSSTCSAAAIVVLGDIQRGARLTEASAVSHVATIFDEILTALPAGTAYTDLAWVLLPGTVRPSDAIEKPAIFSITIADDGAGDAYWFDSGLDDVRGIDRVLGAPLSTWPAIGSELPSQRAQWEGILDEPSQMSVWTLDTHDGEHQVGALARLAQAAGSFELRRQLIAHAAVVVAETFDAIDAPGAPETAPWITARFAVPVARWQPSDDERRFVEAWAREAQPEILEAAYLEGVEWRKSVDELSAVPHPLESEALGCLLELIPAAREYPATFEIVELRLVGSVAAEWVSTLEPVTSPPTGNSEADRRHRALRQYQRGLSYKQFGAERRDAAGVLCVLSEGATSALVARPRTLDGLNLDGATVEADNPGQSGGDLAIFIREASGKITLLPHVDEYSGVNFGYSGSGSHSLARDIFTARNRGDNEQADLGELDKLEQFLIDPRLEHFVLHL